MTVRAIFFWAHLTAGVAAGIVILVMSATGVLLTYERQLIEWSDRGFDHAPPPVDGASRLSVEALLARHAEQRPGDQVTAITLRADRDDPVVVTVDRNTLYLDAYTGQVLGSPTTDVRAAMTTFRSWHRYLALDGDRRALGKAISGWSNFIFLFIVLSGLYLWLPRRWGWTQVKSVALFRGRLRGKARDFNWHNVIGIWSAVPLAIVVATAMPISFPWANALVYRIMGENPPASAATPNRTGATAPSAARTGSASPAASSLAIDALWATAEQQVQDWRSINLRLPSGTNTTAVFAIDSGNGGQPQKRSTLTLNAVTGAVVRWEPFESQTAGRRLRSWTRFTHTGEYYGIAGQTIAGLVSAGAVVLVWTGLSLAWRRFFRRSSTVASASNNNSIAA